MPYSIPGMTDIDAQANIIDEPREVVVRAENVGAVPVFNPLEAEPVTFKRQLVSRQENYDALAAFFRDMLVPDKDFGRLHHADKDKCPKPWQCTYEREPYHYSDYHLWAPGADKVIGMLGLRPSYPEYDDYVRACATGRKITDIIMKCELRGQGDAVVEEGLGACSLSEVKNKLNNAVKSAGKRARVDAVMRLPSISALFEDDFLQQVAAQADRKTGGNSTTARLHESRVQKFNSGARLRVMPIGKKMLGKKFDEMEDYELEYILKEITDKPDIWKAAKRIWDARYPDADTPVTNGSIPNESEPPPAPARAQTDRPAKAPPAPAAPSTNNSDWLKEYEEEAEWARK